MIKVAPSILSADFANLERDVKMLAEKGADYIHIDVMDGCFVPNITIGAPVVQAIRRVTDKVLDVHLMIREPLRYIEDFARAGADIITVHYEADTFENISAAIDKIKSLGCKAGLSLKPATPNPSALAFMEVLDLLLIMTVEPGFGGQALMEHIIPKIRGARDLIEAYFPNVELEVDGGINLENARAVKNAGAQVLVAGSALFSAADIGAFIQNLKSE